MMNDHRVVLITGASSGIGRYCADYLSQQGYRVYGTSRRTDSTNSERGSSDTNLFQTIQMDVNETGSVKKGIDYLMGRESSIDVLVNNAGFAIIGSLEDTTIEEAKSQFETNFFGTLRVCRAVLPIMRRQKAGYILNISSIGGLIGLPFQSAYCGSKFALEGAMEALRLEMKPFGIHVVLIEPGDFRTKLTRRRQKVAETARCSVYLDKFQKVLQIIEAGERNGPTPEPIAALVLKVINMNTPRLRYTVGNFSQRMAVPLKKILPSKLFESLIANNFQAN